MVGRERGMRVIRREDPEGLKPVVVKASQHRPEGLLHRTPQNVT